MWRGAFLLLGLLGTVLAQDDAAARAEVRRTHAAWKGAAGEAPPAAPADATPALREVFAGAPTVAGINALVFAREFAKLPFDGWDREADAALVRDGLRLAAQHALYEGMAEAGVAAADLFLQREPDHVDAARIRGWHRPASLVAANRPADAAAALAKHAGALTRTPGARAWTLRGDLAAARGTFEEAHGCYARARAHTWKKGELDLDAVPKRLRLHVWAANLFATERLDARARLVGKPLPRFEKLEGIGPVAQAIARKPRVIVLFFFTPSDADHFATLRELDRLAQRVGPERLSVLAVTWFESLTEGARGRWMRKANGRDAVDVEPRKFRAGLLELRKELALSIPFAIVKEQHARTWTPEGSSLLVVADAQRRVAYASTDLGRDDESSAVLDLALLRAVLAAQPAR